MIAAVALALLVSLATAADIAAARGTVALENNVLIYRHTSATPAFIEAGQILRPEEVSCSTCGRYANQDRFVLIRDHYPAGDATITREDSASICSRGGRDIRCDVPAGGIRLQLGDQADFVLIRAEYGVAVFGNGGNDFVTGGNGNDFVDGGSGVDTIAGEEVGGSPDIRQLDIDGKADDELTGGPDDDRIDGTDGNDVVTGGAGRDELLGSAGNDFLSGEGDNDKLVGDVGDDVLLGGPNEDQLFGDAGNDVVLGQGGEDFMRGGAHHDRLVGGGDDDDLLGGPGIDVFSYEDSPTGRLDVIGQGGGHGKFGEDDRFSDEPEGLAGSQGDDRLLGNAARNILDGGGGDDTLEAGDDSPRQGSRGDVLIGGAGGDTLTGNRRRDILFGGTGRDFLFGLGEDDRLFGEAPTRALLQSDPLFGPFFVSAAFAAEPQLTGLLLFGTMFGSCPGCGDVLDGGPGGDRMDGQVGFDTVTYAGRQSPVNVRLNTKRDDGALTADRRLDLVDPATEHVIGGDRGDILRGNRRDNVFTGGPGTDVVQTFHGNDVLRLRDGEQELTINCGAGEDKVLLDFVDTRPRLCEQRLRPQRAG